MGEPITTTFERANPTRKTEVQYETKKKIGEGNFGDVYLVDAKIGEGERTRKVKFVLKKFGEKYWRQQCEEDAPKAFKNHENAKKAGLKVFTTYRISKDGKSILMSPALDKDTFCLPITLGSPERHYVDQQGFKNLEEISEFDELCTNIFNEAIKAADNNIVLPQDGYFFINKKGSGEVDFIIGDLDLVYKTNRKNIESQNLNSAYRALNGFLDQYTTRPIDKRKILEEVYSRFKLST